MILGLIAPTVDYLDPSIFINSANMVNLPCQGSTGSEISDSEKAAMHMRH